MIKQIKEVSASLATLLERRRPSSLHYFSTDQTRPQTDKIDPELALRCTVVSNCILVIADHVASLDWRSDDQTVNKLLNKPNPFQNKQGFFFSAAFDMELHGHSYIYRSPTGYLAPFYPKEIEPGFNDQNEPIYRVTSYDSGPFQPGGVQPAERIIDITDLAASSGAGYRKVDLCSESIRIVLDITNAARDLANNGPVGSVVLVSPREEKVGWAKEAAKEISKRFGKNGKKRGGAMALSNGMRLEQFGSDITLDAQAIQSRKDEELKICATFGVPSFMAGITGGDSKYSNLTAQYASFYRDVVAPTAYRIGIAMSDALGVKIEPDLDKVIAGDLASAALIANTLYQGGIFTRARAMRLVGQEPAADGSDDVFVSNPTDTSRSDEGLDPNRPRADDPDETDDGNLLNRPET